MKGYTLQAFYYGQWEDMTTELTKQAILDRKKEYKDNMPETTYRIIKEK